MSDALQETVASHQRVKSCLMTFQTIQTVFLHLLSYLDLQPIFGCFFLFLHELSHRHKTILQSCLILRNHVDESWRAGKEILIVIDMREDGVDLLLVFSPSAWKRLLETKKNMHEVEKSIVNYHWLL